MREADLKRRLAGIEAMLHGATTDCERAPAQHVFDGFRQKSPDELAEDLQFTVPDVWAGKILIAMVRKAGLEPFRLRGQHMVFATTTAGSIAGRFDPNWTRNQAVHTAITARWNTEENL